MNMDIFSYDNQLRSEGRADKAKAIAKKMLEANVPIESIMQFTGLKREEVEGLREAS